MAPVYLPQQNGQWWRVDQTDLCCICHLHFRNKNTTPEKLTNLLSREIPWKLHLLTSHNNSVSHPMLITDLH